MTRLVGMTSLIRRIGAVAAAAGFTLSGGVCPAVAGPMRASQPTGAAAPACSSKDLSAHFRLGEGTASQEHYGLTVRNIAGHRCRLHGYPLVRLVNRRGDTLGRPAAHYGGVATVVLGVGQRATATVTQGSVEVPTAADCRLRHAVGFRLRPQGDRHGLLVRRKIATCTRPDSQGLAATSFARGAAIQY
jgi:hypothetical protein